MEEAMFQATFLKPCDRWQETSAEPQTTANLHISWNLCADVLLHFPVDQLGPHVVSSTTNFLRFWVAILGATSLETGHALFSRVAGTIADLGVIWVQLTKQFLSFNHHNLKSAAVQPASQLVHTTV